VAAVLCGRPPARLCSRLWRAGIEGEQPESRRARGHGNTPSPAHRMSPLLRVVDCRRLQGYTPRLLDGRRVLGRSKRSHSC